VPRQMPPATHTSLNVQFRPSLQTVPSGAKVVMQRPAARSHEASTHAEALTHGTVEEHEQLLIRPMHVPATHVSLLVQLLPSSHGAAMGARVSTGQALLPPLHTSATSH
jgi:hypothetical protein